MLVSRSNSAEKGILSSIVWTLSLTMGQPYTNSTVFLAKVKWRVPKSKSRIAFFRFKKTYQSISSLTASRRLVTISGLVSHYSAIYLRFTGVNGCLSSATFWLFRTGCRFRHRPGQYKIPWVSLLTAEKAPNNPVSTAKSLSICSRKVWQNVCQTYWKTLTDLLRWDCRSLALGSLLKCS